LRKTKQKHAVVLFIFFLYRYFAPEKLNLSVANQFSVTIQTLIGKREFQFTRLLYSEKTVYHVSVFGQYRNRYFTLEFVEDEWEFAKPAFIDYWMAEIIDELRGAIRDHTS
jgi:hypothetical protein